LEYDVGDGDGDIQNDPTWVPGEKKKSVCSPEVNHISKNHHEKTTKKTSTMRRTSWSSFHKKSTDKVERSILDPNIKNIIRKCLRKNPASSTLDTR
jgi:hypothetical protein